MKIDAHQHFWYYNPQMDSWIDDSMGVLKQDFLPPQLKSCLDQQGIQGSIAVQADPSETETKFLLDLAAQYDYIKGVVGWVDLLSPNVEERISQFSKSTHLKGFRHLVQGEAEVDFVLKENFNHGIKALGKYDFTYDILIYPRHLPFVNRLVERHPGQPFVLDHLAKPNIKGKEIKVWQAHIKELAQASNVTCKLSGMLTEASWDSWCYEDFVPYLEVIMENFGVDRIMFGSDWPVCLLAGSYSEVNGIVESYIKTWNEADQLKVLGGNAVKFYKI